jgi:hypothetical protein
VTESHTRTPSGKKLIVGILKEDTDDPADFGEMIMMSAGRRCGLRAAS